MENTPMEMTLSPRGCRSFGGLSYLRRLSTLCLAPAFLAASTAGPVSASEKVATATEPVIEHGPWHGGAFDDPPGRFDYCVATADYEENGIKLSFVLASDSSFRIVLGNDRWRLGSGERYQVSLQIDSRTERKLEAIGFDDLLSIPIGPIDAEDRLYDALGQARLLTVFAAKATFSFPLTAQDVALQALKDCLRQRTATAQSRPPAESEGTAATPIAPPAESAPQAAPGSERQSASKEGTSKTGALPLGTAELMSMLNASGVAAPVLLPVERMMLVDRPFFQRTWSVPNETSILGRVFHYPFPLGNPEDWLWMIGNSLMEGCRGEITSAVDSVTALEGAVVGHVIGWAAFVCDDPEVRTAFYVSGLFGAEEALVFLTIGSGPGVTTARTVDEALRRQIIVQGPGQ